MESKAGKWAAVIVGSVVALIGGYGVTWANLSDVMGGLMLVLGLGVAFTPKVVTTFKAWRK